MRALASPASLKGVLSAAEAAARLAEGMRRVDGVETDELPVADGGEGTAEVIHGALGGEWREAVVADPFGRPAEARYLVLPSRVVVVEAAEAIGLGRLSADELDPLAASSRGLGELMVATLAAEPAGLIVCLGGSATVDGGAGLLSELGSWPASVPITVACDVRSPLLGERGAARVFGPQKGATPEMVEELEERLAAMEELAPYRDLPGAGAAGGLGAALASLGGRLLEGAEHVLDVLEFDRRIRGAALVVTGEGIVDRSTFEGKAPGAVVLRCVTAGVPSVLFGGRIADELEGQVDVVTLSGKPGRAGEDLVALGEELARGLAEGSGRIAAAAAED